MTSPGNPEARDVMMAALHSRDGHALKHTHGELVDAIIAALSSAGMKILAREPTDAMAATWGDEDGPDPDAQNVWRSYWDAASLPPAGDER